MTIGTTVVVGTSQVVATLINQGLKGDPGERGPAGPSGSASTVGKASTAISGHLAVRWTSNGELALASNDQPAHAYAVAGIATNAASAGGDLTVQSAEVLQHSGWAWTANQPVFLGVNGALTQALPSPGSYMMVIGIAISTTAIAISIQPPITLT